MVPYSRWEYWKRGVGRHLKVLWFSGPPIVASLLAWMRDNAPTDLRGYLLWVPSFRWYWHWYLLAFLVASIVIVLVTAPAANREMLKEQRLRHIKSFKAFRERNEKPPVIIIQGTPDPPNLVCSLGRRTVYRDDQGMLFERDAGAEIGSDFFALTADFKNLSTRTGRTGEARELSARLTFRPFDETQHDVSVDRGTWLRNKNGTVNIGLNMTRELVVATIEYARLFSVRHLSGLDGGDRVTTRVAIPDPPLEVHVRLRAELEDKFIRRAHLIVERDQNGDVQIRLMSVWRGHQLKRFIDQGELLSLRAFQVDTASKAVVEIEYQQWQDEVVSFLHQRWDSDHVEKFVPLPPNKPRSKWQDIMFPREEPQNLQAQIDAKIKTLRGFIDEIVRDMQKEYSG